MAIASLEEYMQYFITFVLTKIGTRCQFTTEIALPMDTPLPQGRGVELRGGVFL
ncbi:hypothetical protein [Nostoc sp. MG11]|uniref:hypothetical protein n=1 Tax=Nostoc sp. MG11 TaxID=2721166 RepID=UPI00186959E3|nr:hypothetical protein [Nostoc sp. MG11]